MHTRRLLLWVVMVCGVIAVALLAIAWFDPYMLGVRVENFVSLPLLMGAGALLAFTCLQVGQKRLRALMMIGAMSSAAGTIACCLSFLAETVAAQPAWSYETNRTIALCGWMLMLTSAVLAHWGLLSLLTMKRMFGRLVRFAAQGLSGLTAAIIVMMVLSVFFDWMDQVAAVVVAVVGVHIVALLGGLAARRMGWKPSVAMRLALLGYLAAAVTLLAWGSQFIAHFMTLGSSPFQSWYFIEQMLMVLSLATLVASGMSPVLAYFEWVARKEQPGSMQLAKIAVQIVCPRCRSSQQIHTGGDRCGGCGLSMNLQIEEPRCECGYLLYQLHEGKCPECGRTIAGVAQPVVAG